MSDFDHNLHEEIAAGETWLRDMKTAPPSAEAMARFKAAVRSELSATPSRRGWRLRHWHGALAAAAMLMLAVTIGWESYDRYEGGGTPEVQVAALSYEYEYVSLLPSQDENDLTSSVYEEVEDIAEETDDLGDWSLSDSGLFAAIEGTAGDGDDAAHESGALRLSPGNDESSEGVV